MLHNQLLHLSGAMFKEAIATEPLQEQLRRRAVRAFGKPPAGERSVIRTLLFSMNLTFDRPHLYRAFKDRVAGFVAELPVPYTLDHDADFYHVTIPARGASGFTIHVNVGWQSGCIVIGGGALLEFYADTPKDAATVAQGILDATRQLAQPGVRLRLHKAGNTTRAWAIEVPQGSHWIVAHRGRHWLFNYLGKRSEVVFENQGLAIGAHAG